VCSSDIVFFSKNELKRGISEKSLKADIIKFNPELVITFNYATYNKLLDCVSCPIVIWDADLYHLWNQVEFIKKNVSRFEFFCFSKFGIKYAKDFFNVHKNKIFYVPAATSLEAKNLKKSTEISFIGTFFGMNNIVAEYVKKYSGNEILLQIMSLIRNNPFITKEQILSSFPSRKCEKLDDFQKIDEKFYSGFFSSEDRINILNSVCDLGLKLYGDEGWLSTVHMLPSLTSCFNKEKVYSPKSNQDLYNSSKICLNINHSQSVQGMPWRVCDIMATSGCLISSYTPFIDEVFGRYIKIPMYNNKFEARDLCIKLLKDKAWRKEIIAGSNLAIEDGHRWHHRFKQMEEIFGIQLLNNNSKGSVKILQPEETFLSKYFSISIENVIVRSNSVVYKKKKDLLKKRDYFHFRTKIWHGKRLDIKIKKPTSEE
jgi:hypothetical protein